jgi:hypothetical protein
MYCAGVLVCFGQFFSLGLSLDDLSDQIKGLTYSFIFRETSSVGKSMSIAELLKLL